MRIRAIRLSDIRRFDRPVAVEGIGDGLNLLSAPNEAGKSTLFDALHAAFFLPHRSQAKEAKALRPRVGGAPEVTVEIETAEGRYEIAKRWFSRPMAEVRRLPPGGGPRGPPRRLRGLIRPAPAQTGEDQQDRPEDARTPPTWRSSACIAPFPRLPPLRPQRR